MKCPKCGYLGFEDVPRCRHCGYDFSLAQASAPEVSIRDESVLGETVQELSLNASVPAGAWAHRSESFGFDEPAVELPLFGPPISDGEPLITKPSPPRPPLAVRRSTPEVPRLRSTPPRVQTFDFKADVEPPGAAVVPIESLDPVALPTQTPAVTAGDPGIAPRLVAVAIDGLVLGAIDVVVVYFTMQICGLHLQELSLLPKAPLAAFLLAQNLGYLITFTAGGQTLGKMAVGIRVVSNESSPLDFGRACVRELLWLILAIPAGLGFLSALGPHHRGLHDRFAGTRVVR